MPAKTSCPRCLDELLDVDTWWDIERACDALEPWASRVEMRKALALLKRFTEFLPQVEAMLARVRGRSVRGFEYLDLRAVEVIRRFLTLAKDGKRQAVDARDIAAISRWYLEERVHVVRRRIERHLLERRAALADRR